MYQFLYPDFTTKLWSKPIYLILWQDIQNLELWRKIKLNSSHHRVMRYQGCVCVHTQHIHSPASSMDQELFNWNISNQSLVAFAQQDDWINSHLPLRQGSWKTGPLHLGIMDSPRSFPRQLQLRTGQLELLASTSSIWHWESSIPRDSLRKLKLFLFTQQSPVYMQDSQEIQNRIEFIVNQRDCA